MPLTSPGNDDDTGENHQPTLRKNTAEPVEQTLKQNILHGTAMNNTMRQTSGAMAIALLVTIMNTHTAAAMRTGVPEAAASAIGVRASFRTVAIVCAVCLVASLFIRDRGRRLGQQR